MKQFFSRHKFIVAIGALCASVSMLAATPALGAVSHTSPAQRVKAELRAAIRTQLSYKPGGRVIGANQISYDHGALVVTIRVPGVDFTCPAGDVCFFQRPNLRGNAYEVNPNGYSLDRFYRLNTWYPYGVLGSVHNKWVHRVYISYGTPGSPNLCYPPGGTGSPNDLLNYVFFGSSDTC